MPKVFISHKSEEKSIAIKIKDYLEKCFVSCWLDKDDLVGGQNLNDAFLAGIGGRKTIALVSEKYMDSPYCRNEFGWAFDQAAENVIPVLISDHNTLLEKAQDANFSKIAQVLKHNLAIEYDQYNPSVAFEQIAKAVHKDESVWFRPLVEKTVGGQKLQFIEFEGLPSIPTDLFKTWDVRLDDFVSISDSDNRPIKRNIPVAIGGRGPNWLYAFLVIPFANNREVFIFNNNTGEYVCAYARRDQQAMLGKVLKE
jgi:hypothetical protein